MLRPSIGKVTVFDGREPHQARARIGYMSHAPMLYDELTAQENLRYFASLYPGRECLAPADALTQVGLNPDLPRTFGQYSQGMRQRTSLARVLLARSGTSVCSTSLFPTWTLKGPADGRTAGPLPAADRTIVLTTHQRDRPLPSPIRCWRCMPDEWPRSSPGTHAMKTNGARFLETWAIAVELREYEVDPRVCRRPPWRSKIGMPAEQVFKTLLTTGGQRRLTCSP